MGVPACGENRYRADQNFAPHGASKISEGSYTLIGRGALRERNTKSATVTRPSLFWARLADSAA